MKKGGLVFLSIILALVIIAIGASAGALAYTNGVPAMIVTRRMVKRNLPRIRKMQVNPQRAVKTAMIRLPTELLKLVNQKKIAKMAKTATIQRVL